ncbi:MAG: dipeptide ABC transporter ATP-binding protein [Pseudomonadota bacterium]
MARSAVATGTLMTALLHIENLSLKIGETPILSDVGLALHRGEIYGLAGESGSGKSLTALCVMGLLPAGAVRYGAASLAGQNLFALSEDALCQVRGRRIGMIFQEPMTALNPLMTIGKQISETLRVHHALSGYDARTVVREKLDRVGLGNISPDAYPHELSGGQRQRVMIAQAIACGPDLLIADEPTTALDVMTQAGILALLEDLVTDGLAVLLITHDLAILANLARKISIMYAGEIIEQGPPETLFRRARHPYTRKLLAAATAGGVQPARPARHTVQPLLKVDDVRVCYPRKTTHLFRTPPAFFALEDISFSIHHGESVGLVGESGCGKSTLARALLGLMDLQSGQIYFAGQDSKDHPSRAQIVFQDPASSFNPRHKVARLIAEPFYQESLSQSEREGRIDEVLVDVGLSREDRDKYIHEFSGGQRQRLAIARALVTKPRLIILDEATSALDVSIRAQILRLLDRLREAYGLSYLMISHDLAVVRSMTDRLLVMRRGKIIEHGETAGVLADPQHAYTKALIDAMPHIPLDWLAQSVDAPQTGETPR